MKSCFWKFAATIVIAIANSAFLIAQESGINLSDIRATYFEKFVEPEYQHEPRYSLLVFDPTADKRIGIVLDGFDRVYVDLNGNSDLTEEGEQFGVAKSIAFPQGQRHSAANYFVLGSIDGHDVTLDVMVPDIDFVPKNDNEKLLVAQYLENGWCDVALARLPGMPGRTSASGIMFTKSTADSQVTWLGGPLSIIPLTESLGLDWSINKWTDLPNGQRSRINSIEARVGTIGLPAKNSDGMAFSPISTSEVPDDISPIATIGFTTGIVEVPLATRANGGVFKARISVPENETANEVQVALTFPGWRDHHVKTSTRKLSIKH